MPTPILRRAEAADAARLAPLALRTFRETFLEEFAIPYPAADLAAFEEARFTPAAVAARLAHPEQAFWVVEDDEQLLAYANAGPCTLPHPEVDPGAAELHRLYVGRAAQGRGLGRRLLEAALGWMAAERPGSAWIGVWSGNVKARRLYEARGFAKVGEYDFMVGTWRDREHILRRP